MISLSKDRPVPPETVPAALPSAAPPASPSLAAQQVPASPLGDVTMDALVVAVTKAFKAVNKKKPRPKPGSSGQVCRAYAATGTCRFGDSCIHSH